MQRSKKQTLAIKSIAVASVLAIAGCDREAGRAVDASAFGTSTENNYLVQTGQRSYAISLAKRFAEEVPSTINFAFDSYQLDQNARAALRVQADWIKQFPEVTFKVYGHTDLVGSAAYNKKLGLRRAQAAVNYLISQGISRDRLAAVVSYGKTQPLIVTQGRERKNRRTVTEVSGFLKRHPTVLNGKYAEIIFRDYVASAVPATELTGITVSGTGSSE
ncbi:MULTISPECIES: OmpA family protein [Halocynthiibacter]|uniref:OmpA family protein n=1 Tax=Halocynthiibacter halioticoli TaxID=2986804 RepID=A0AAE3J3Y6_9RHOB|nr:MULTISPECIES: OmpA family protein [Halocynthiibacter]MCV6825272.1 OmpA family protein [Halocynthiibacter halioticoli]MCW4058273.1 OmpA family protein [Halocynthiibacter sp. SDUM655004]MDE0588706.1 OmpA family protein [Halocynthiibacter sp. C4]